MKTNPLAHDLDYILTKTCSLWDELRAQQIFITGGTGFFGCWLLESFLWVNKTLNLNAKATVLTRNIENFANKHSHLFHQPCITFSEGDIRNFEFPKQRFSHIIHAATDTNARLSGEDKLTLHASISQGTQRILEFAKHCGAKKFLLTSSGAVYGKQPEDLSHIPENYSNKPQLYDTNSTYALAKCTAEHLCYLYALECGLEVKIARCFAFVGPYLPLDGHYAIGNFIHDGLKGGPILVNGDGTPFRSYLYAADLAIWLWTILFCGKTAYPYNVGSDEAYSILDVANLVAKTFDIPSTVNVKQVKKTKATIERYVPNINRAREELNLTATIKLRDAIQLTKKWHSQI